ncbi:MAG TPA: hypothetical protein VGM50_11735 [Gemmatimonadaceae bacterium]
MPRLCVQVWNRAAAVRSSLEQCRDHAFKLGTVPRFARKKEQKLPETAGYCESLLMATFQTAVSDTSDKIFSTRNAFINEF